MKAGLLLSISVVLLMASNVQAAKESGNAKVVKKLQMMVKDATAEKERLTAENVKIIAELDQLKKQVEQDKKDKSRLEAIEKKLGAEIEYQKKNVDQMRGRLEDATTRIHEVIDKFNALNQSKNDLALEHNQLKSTQQFTSTELKRCESNNRKMYEHTKTIVNGYEKCHDLGILDTLVGTEPFTQIKSVEFENIVQEYEDKLRKQQFHKTEPQAQTRQQ